MEILIIDWIKVKLEQPLELTIEQVRGLIDEEIRRNDILSRGKFGKVSTGEIFISSSIIGQPNRQRRSFTLNGPRRKTFTLLVSETIEKDSNNGFYSFITPQVSKEGGENE